MKTLSYPAFCLKRNGDYWTVIVPDFKELIVSESTLEGAILSASQEACSRIVELLRKGESIPKSTDILKAEIGPYITNDSSSYYTQLLILDLEKYIRENCRYDSEDIRIPAFLNRLAYEKDIDIEDFLLDKLLDELFGK